MKSFTGKGIVLLLVLTIAFGCFVPAFADAAEPEEKTVKLVTLGDSTIGGLGLTSYQTSGAGAWGFLTRVEGSTADRIACGLEERGYTVELTQLAIPGLRTYDLRAFLDGSYPLDYYFLNGTTGKNQGAEDTNSIDNMLNACGPDGIAMKSASVGEKREYLLPLFADAVADADLIVIDIGANNLSSYLQTAMAAPEDPDIAALIESFGFANCTARLEAMTALVRRLLPEYDAAREKNAQVTRLVKALMYTTLDACLNSDAIMRRIYELNPDADVVLLAANAVMDPKMMLEMDGFGLLPIGALMNGFMNLINEYRAEISPCAREYRYADVTDRFPCISFLDELDEEDFDPAALSGDMKALLMDIMRKPFYLNVDRGENYADYLDVVERIKLMYDRKLLSLSYPPVPGRAAEFFAGVPLTDFTEEELEVIAKYTTMWLTAADANAGPHPNRAGHQAKADAVLYALDSGDSARVYVWMDKKENIQKFSGKVVKTVLEKAEEIRETVRETVRKTIREAVRSALERLK